VGFLTGRVGEKRSISYQDFWGQGGNAADLLGQGMEAALSLVPLYSATRLLADQFSSTPLQAYRQNGQLAERIPDPVLFKNPSVVAGGLFAWKYRACTSLLLRGNAYGLVTQMSPLGWPTMVEWVHPSTVEVDDSNYPNAKYYLRGRPVELFTNRHEVGSIVHIPGYSLPGRTKGLAPITAFRLMIEQGLQAQKFSVDWFRNGAAPTGHLKNVAKTLEPEEASVIRDRFEATTADRSVFVSGNDWSFDPISISADDAAFVTTARLTAGQVASVYGLDPEDVGGEAANSLTYATMEQKGIRFTTFPLRPLAIRFEEAVTEMLPKPQYTKFNLDALVRADIKTRFEVHQIGLTTGLETLDEGRAKEDKPPLTPEEIAFWQANYPKPAAVPTAPAPTAKA